ncbi:uncharacterized protein BJ171DRAFT_520521 [Polychytrium aggregatum]|uniref:uncharacterized protein n=1 Tax=Polychytrium aggregatum TaxID=110093 RepID=UPI0022FE99C0|nr:uncharacterized protein BJ171DRAFT_520521 [Polychytrium aggregatum]KAI9197296.1 hypothetical protein BJ171DRAFT_520521 [Polychytrium aggregatum]
MTSISRTFARIGPAAHAAFSGLALHRSFRYNNLNAAASTALALAQQRRHETGVRIRPVAVQIFDPWIPKTKGPSLLSVEGRQDAWEKAKKFITATVSYVVIMRNSVEKWKPKPFAADAEKIYIAMNEAFAGGEKDVLPYLVTDAMLVKLNPDIKATQRLGRGVWKYHGSVERPVIVHAAVAQLQESQRGDAIRVAQVTVKIHTKQSFAIYSKGPEAKLLGGNPAAVSDVLEYVVFEKRLAADDPYDWRIAGKIPPRN